MLVTGGYQLWNPKLESNALSTMPGRSPILNVGRNPKQHRLIFRVVEKLKEWKIKVCVVLISLSRSKSLYQQRLLESIICFCNKFYCVKKKKTLQPLHQMMRLGLPATHMYIYVALPEVHTISTITVLTISPLLVRT